MFKDRKKERPRKQEDRVAEEIGGKRVPASGALRHMPGDATNDRFLVDAKDAEKSFQLTAGLLRKVCREATSKGKEPVLQVDMNALPPHQRRWAVIPYDQWLELIGEG